jgi:hypothetical protein
MTRSCQSLRVPSTTRRPRSVAQSQASATPQDGPAKVMISRRGGDEHPVQHAPTETTQKLSHPPPFPSSQSKHVLNCLVQNEPAQPGVLSRVSGILARRGFNIDSLVVCRTEIRDLRRMCIVISGQDGAVEQASPARRPRAFTLPRTFTYHTHLLTPHRVRLRCPGTRVGRSGLRRDAHDLARTAPRQRVHPRARVPRRPALCFLPPNISFDLGSAQVTCIELRTMPVQRRT